MYDDKLCYQHSDIDFVIEISFKNEGQFDLSEVIFSFK